MRQSAETGHIRNLRHIVFSLLDQCRRPVQLVPLEEDARILTCQALHLIIELGAGNLENLSHSRHSRFRIGTGQGKQKKKKDSKTAHSLIAQARTSDPTPEEA